MAESDGSTLPDASNIALRELENGLLLAARENFVSPAVIVRGLVEVGSMDEPEELRGLASLVATLLARGTHSMDYDALNEAIESVGASVGLGGQTHTSYASARCLAEDFHTITGLLGDMLRHPTFPEEHLERVRKQRITALRERENNTRAVAELEFYAHAYPRNHPYHDPSSGYPASIERITRDDLVAFHERYYGPTDGIFVVVGAVPAEEALDRLESLLGDWVPARGARGKQAAPPVEWPESRKESYHPIEGKTQSDIVLGLPTIPRNHPDFTALRLANSVLGVFGMMGRIGKNVRDTRGLAYYARSGIDATLGPGAWTAIAGVAPDKVDEAVAAIREEWVRLAEELVPEEELADSKALATGSLPLRLETNGGVARVIIDMLYYDLGLDYLHRVNDLIHAISAEEVRRVSRSYFDPERAILTVAGPPRE